MCLGLMLGKQKEELKELREEKLNFELDWFFTRSFPLETRK